MAAKEVHRKTLIVSRTMEFLALLLVATNAVAAPVVEISLSGNPPKAQHSGIVYEIQTSQRVEVAENPNHLTSSIISSLDSTTERESTSEPEDSDQLTSWSIAWYISLLAAFIIFFILIGLTEIFCRHRHRNSRYRSNRRRIGPQLNQVYPPQELEPPPAYDLFKPPSYNTLFPPDSMKFQPKCPSIDETSPKQLVYVVNVHGGRGVS